VNRLKEPLLKVREMAARLSVSIPSAYRLLHSGAIPIVHVGERSVRVREQDVERYIRDRRKTA
jgi:excisionase family DNA binding protein